MAARTEPQAAPGADASTAQAVSAAPADFCVPIDALPDPVFVLAAQRDTSGNVVDFEYRFVNDSGLRLYGKSRDEVVGHRQLELFPSVRDSEIWHKYLEVLDTGEHATIDVPWFDENNVAGAFQLSFTRYGDGIIVEARDVTDRVETMKQLARTADLLTRAQEIGQSGGWEHDVTTGSQFWSDEVYHILGFERPYDSVDPATALARFDPETEAIMTEAWKRALDTGEPYDLEGTLTREDGRQIWVRTVGRPVIEDGRVVRIIGNIVDVTDRRQAEEQLRYERDLNTATLDVAGALILVIDTEWRIQRFNRQCELVTGYREAEVLGRHAEFLVPPSERLPAFSNVEPTAPDHPVSQVNHWLTKSGELRMIRWSNAALVDADGHRTHLVAVGIDITEQQEAEAELTRRAHDLEVANRELARSNSDLEQFAYVASHDLREPLRAIAQPIEYVATRYEGQLDEKAEELLGFALSGSQRMNRLIDDLLAYSRIGRIERAAEVTDSERVVRQALTALGPTLDNAGAVVSVEPLPAVLADGDQLGQVFSNLISNAVKFVPAGVTPHVTIAAKPAGAMWRFTITDNGIGIPEAQRDRVFAMFKRLHPPDEYPGTGIGLAIVKKIIERHDGELGIDDAPTGTGTQVWFTLPAATAS